MAENEQSVRAVEMMIRTEHMHRTMIESRAKEIGLHRTQHRILMHLAKHGRLPSQKELAEHLNITPAAITIALKKIERDGYVERTLGEDNRYNVLCITEKGREIVKKTRRLFSEADAAMFLDFSDSELRAYVSFLEKIQKNIQLQTETLVTSDTDRKEKQR